MSTDAEAVIIPWMHILSEEHSKALQFVNTLPEGSVLAIEQEPEKVLSREFRQNLESFLANLSSITHPRMILEGLRASALLQVLLVAREKKIKIIGIDSPQINRKQREITKQELEININGAHELLRIELEREEHFVKQLEPLLRGNKKVYIMVGANHAVNVAEALKKKGFVCNVANTISQDTQEYCKYRNTLKKKLAEKVTPLVEEHQMLSDWLLRRTRSWLLSPIANRELHEMVRTCGTREFNRTLEKRREFKRPKERRKNQQFKKRK